MNKKIKFLVILLICVLNISIITGKTYKITETLYRDFTSLFIPANGFGRKELITTSTLAAVNIPLMLKYDETITNNYVNNKQFENNILHNTAKTAYWTGASNKNLIYFTAGITGSLLGSGYIFKEQKHINTAFVLSESILFSAIIVEGTKTVIGRTRPNHSSSTTNFHPFSTATKFHSIPSGHTTIPFTIASVLSNQYDKWYIKIPSYLFAIGSGLERIEHKKHWTSDVVIGAFLGNYIGSKISSRHDKRKPLSNYELNFYGKSIQLQYNF